MSFGLDALFGIPDTFTTQLLILAVLITIYILSAISGVNKGIQLLSRANIILSGLLITFILVFGPTAFIFKGFFNGFGIYLENFFQMATFREDPEWLSWWTVFFWGWFLGYGPLMAMFVARIHTTCPSFPRRRESTTVVGSRFRGNDDGIFLFVTSLISVQPRDFQLRT